MRKIGFKEYIFKDGIAIHVVLGVLLTLGISHLYKFNAFGFLILTLIQVFLFIVIGKEEYQKGLSESEKGKL